MFFSLQADCPNHYFLKEGIGMGDCYKEILISRLPQKSDLIKKILLIAADVVVAYFALMIPLVLVGLMAMIFLTVFLFRNMNVEYEYIYVNGDLDIDKVMNKERRKKCEDLSLDNLEICARTGSEALRGPMHDAKVCDYTSGKADAPSWTLIYNAGDAGKKAIVAELDEEVITDLWKRGPRKVVRN